MDHLGPEGENGQGLNDAEDMECFQAEREENQTEKTRV